MKKLFQNHRLLKLLAIGCPLLLTACTNADYDFDNVDYTLGFGSGELSLPGNNSTAEILLDDLLKIEGSDLISTLDNGDYVFGKQPDAVNPVSVTIDPINLLDSRKTEEEVTVNLPDAVQLLAGTTINVTDIVPEGIGAEGNVATLDYDFELPASVQSLNRLILGRNGEGASLSLTLTLPEAVKRFEYIDVDLPDNLELTSLTQVAGSTFDARTNKLRLSDYRNQGSLTLQFKATAIDVSYRSDDNFVQLEGGHIKMRGTVTLGTRIAELQVPAATSIKLGGSVDFTGVDITGADGVFDPEINLTEAGTVNITSIPDFLLDDEVVADLDNPQIWLNIRSTMPLGGTIKAHLYSDTYPQGIVLDGDKSIRINGSADGETEATTQVVICRHTPAGLAAGTQVITDDNLSRLVNKLQEGMTIHFDVTEVKAAQDRATVLLGHEYHLTPQYNFTAPLAFGPEAMIVYRKSFDGWHDDLDGLKLSAHAKIIVTGTAVNRIPADLTLEATAIDEAGNEVPGLDVNLIKKTVAGTTGQAVTSPLEVEIIDATGDGISKLDGLQIKLKASSNDALRGQTLNKQTQTLTLQDISVTIQGKVIYDAN